MFVRAGESQPFILKVKVPDNRIDNCLYKGVDTYDSSITADIQLCPNVVRLFVVLFILNLFFPDVFFSKLGIIQLIIN